MSELRALGWQRARPDCQAHARPARGAAAGKAHAAWRTFRHGARRAVHLHDTSQAHDFTRRVSRVAEATARRRPLRGATPTRPRPAARRLRDIAGALTYAKTESAGRPAHARASALHADAAADSLARSSGLGRLERGLGTTAPGARRRHHALRVEMPAHPKASLITRSRRRGCCRRRRARPRAQRDGRPCAPGRVARTECTALSSRSQQFL